MFLSARDVYNFERPEREGEATFETLSVFMAETQARNQGPTHRMGGGQE